MAVEKVAEAHDAMGWLEFVAAMTGSLAWPVAAVVIACVFRSQISGLLAKIRKLTWGDKSADFTDQLDQIEAATLTAEVPTPITEQAQEVDEANEHRNAVEAKDNWRSGLAYKLPDKRYQDLLTVSPEAAILDAWKPIEYKLRAIEKDERLVSRKSKGVIFRKPTALLLRDFLADGIMSEATYNNLSAMLKLRNEAAHLDNVTAVDAIRFYDLTQQALRDLSAYEPKIPE